MNFVSTSGDGMHAARSSAENNIYTSRGRGFEEPTTGGAEYILSTGNYRTTHHNSRQAGE